ncbi:MAG: RibD family protein [Syntrophobacteria bacterium]
MSVITTETFLSDIKTCLEQAEEHRRRTGRPFCTLTYAQSVDGSIACNPMTPMALSGHESALLTHHLRAWHDAILVGIRTVLADNPRLNVRLISGQSPQPVVLDSKLRMPLDSNLLNDGIRRPWIATTKKAGSSRQHHLETSGAQVFRFPPNHLGWVALEPLLDKMGRMGVNSLMVEGGARVLTSFMKARMVDQMIITIAPLIVGGVHAYSRLSRDPALLPRLHEVRHENFGRDLVVWCRPAWEEE